MAVSQSCTVIHPTYKTNKDGDYCATKISVADLRNLENETKTVEITQPDCTFKQFNVALTLASQGRRNKKIICQFFEIRSEAEAPSLASSTRQSELLISSLNKQATITINSNTQLKSRLVNQLKKKSQRTNSSNRTPVQLSAARPQINSIESPSSVISSEVLEQNKVTKKAQSKPKSSGRSYTSNTSSSSKSSWFSWGWFSQYFLKRIVYAAGAAFGVLVFSSSQEPMGYFCKKSDKF
ncbi:hypothetical protein D5018_08155 [Parashewanella curva]|uniref:Uncharacterized protein n=1 Tax=Parashewanella curva TaxID=2338552 RepID=A0A3L8PXS7_9GAMM|nr:hypothetical protein [Parashewanella curva]RLV60226.1 hypothetical protein D5018_08155 [Parashewanella curva]